VPQAAYAVSQTGPAFSLGRRPSPRSQTLACSHTAARNSSLPMEMVKKILPRKPPYSNRKSDLQSDEKPH